MKSRRRLLRTLGTVLVTGAGCFVAAAFTAVAPAYAATNACVGVVSQSDVSPPAGYTQIINANMQVNNDEDSGFVGYWALDNYTKHIQVWTDGSGHFYVAVLYQGTWQTFAGALSPGNGVTEPNDGTGSIKGGYTATMTGPMVSPLTAPTHGTIGSYDFGGTKADVLLGTYGAGQHGDTNSFSWLSLYFPQSTVDTFAYTNGGNGWGWRYTGNTTSGPWCNTGLLASGSGDIVTH